MIRNLNEENKELKKTIASLETKQNKHVKILIGLGVFVGVCLLIGLAVVLITLVK